MSVRMARYVFRTGRILERELDTTFWPSQIEVRTREPLGPARTARLRKTDDWYGAARVYREGTS